MVCLNKNRWNSVFARGLKWSVMAAVIGLSVSIHLERELLDAAQWLLRRLLAPVSQDQSYPQCHSDRTHSTLTATLFFCTGFPIPQPLKTLFSRRLIHFDQRTFFPSERQSNCSYGGGWSCRAAMFTLLVHMLFYPCRQCNIL